MADPAISAFNDLIEKSLGNLLASAKKIREKVLDVMMILEEVLSVQKDLLFRTKGHQVNYTREAILKGTSTVGICSIDEVIYGSKKKLSIKLQNLSKQCSSFKIRAEAVKNGLESAVTGITVVINPEKPRRGCFEIRQSGGEVFVSLLAMPRPFTKMKNLDMDQVVTDIAKKLA